MKHASYRKGVIWIAFNDNSGEDGPDNPAAEENIKGYISVALLAELFGVQPSKVAREVLHIRATTQD
jgi:hypothetical protein